VEDYEELENFELIQTTPLDAIDRGEVKQLPQSDLCIQTPNVIAQYRFKEDDGEGKKYKIKPGVWTLAETNIGMTLKKLKLKTHDLLQTASNTTLIKKEANLFFEKIDVYKKFNKDPKRAILLYSKPGQGKSSTISQVSDDFIKEDSGTVVIFWDTSSIRPGSVNDFLSTSSEFSKKCTRLLFVMEDIGGGNVEEYHGPRSADSGLLELLDGASVSFSIPTFIIATTNTPESLLKSLADRPGRFDQMFELPGPDANERVELAEHIAKRKVTDEEKEALMSKDADGLSIAHISEVVIRSELHDKTFGQVINEMKNHTKKVEAAFQKAQSKMGL
jgi:hypothetical protein